MQSRNETQAEYWRRQFAAMDRTYNRNQQRKATSTSTSTSTKNQTEKVKS